MSYLPHVDLGPLGAFLRRAREAARLSIKEFAFALDYSPTHLCDIENGRRRVTRPLCDDLSAKLGLDRSELYARAGHLSDGVLGYLGRRPKAMGILELLAEQDANEGVVGELIESIRWKKSGGRPEEARDPDPDSELSAVCSALSDPRPPTPDPRSCNHHSDCEAVDRRHPGGGHCRDADSEPPTAENCPRTG